MILPEIIAAGFLMGAAGSLHCIGMCGPLSLVLPTAHLSSTEKFFSLTLYQFGRIITYAALGTILGLTGQLIHIAGFQYWFSTIAGSAILLMAIIYFFGKTKYHFVPFRKFYQRVQYAFATILRNHSGHKLFLLMGMTNGLLPCGMVYLALATAVSFANFGHAIVFMGMFGAGTFPAMMLAGFSLQMINSRVRNSFRNVVPVFIAITGLVLILRGISIDFSALGLPYKLMEGKIVSCGH